VRRSSVASWAPFMLVVPVVIAVAGAGPRLTVLAILALLAGLIAWWLAERPSRAVTAAVFCIVTAPTMRITVAAGVPIYIADVLGVLAAVTVARTAGWHRVLARLPVRTRWLLLGYVGALAVPLATQVLQRSTLLGIYGFLREVAAFSLVAVGIWAAVGARQRTVVERPLILGGCVAAILALTQRVPGLTGLVPGLLSAFNPGLASAAERTYPDRSYGLVGAPTALSGLLLIALLFAVLSSWTKTPLLRLVIVLVIGAGIVATASRQWLPALLVVVIILGLIGTPDVRRTMRQLTLGGLAALVLALAVAPGGAGVLGERFNSLGSDDENVATRLERQSGFFEEVLGDPARFVVGEGFALQDVAARESDASRRGYSDNSLLLELGNRGLLAFITLLTIVIIAARVGWRAATRSSAAAPWLAASLALVVLGLSDNYFSEAVAMRAIMWLVIGGVLSFQVQNEHSRDPTSAKLGADA
jgi:hypothetical protein